MHFDVQKFFCESLSFENQSTRESYFILILAVNFVVGWNVLACPVSE